MEKPFFVVDEKYDHVKLRDLADFLARETLDAKNLALGAI
jgi:hypothetical protein